MFLPFIMAAIYSLVLITGQFLFGSQGQLPKSVNEIRSIIGVGSQDDRPYIIKLDMPETEVQRQNANVPTDFQLLQNRPNPFNAETSIGYRIHTSTHVEITVFDVQGREIQTLVDAHHEPGSYQTAFNASHLISGLYFYRIQMKDFVDMRKMVLME